MKEAENAKCEAFPKGIPQRILNNDVDHAEPLKGDNGVQFEPIKGER